MRGFFPPFIPSREPSVACAPRCAAVAICSSHCARLRSSVGRKEQQVKRGCYGHTSGPGTQRRTTPAAGSRPGGEHRYAVPSLPVAVRVLGPAGLQSHARARRRSPRGDLYLADVACHPLLDEERCAELCEVVSHTLLELVEERPRWPSSCPGALSPASCTEEGASHEQDPDPPGLLQRRAAARAEDLERPLLLVASPALQGPYARTALLVFPMRGQHAGFILNRSTDVKMASVFPDHAPSAKVADRSSSAARR